MAHVEEHFPIDVFAHYFRVTFFSMCQILGLNPSIVIAKAYTHMGIQIQHPHFVVLYDFAPYLADNIHEGLLQIKKGDINTLFYWYSILMYMYLYKNADFFAKEMELGRAVDGENMLVQVWSMDISWDRKDASYVRFDNCFLSRLKAWLVVNPPRIPVELHVFFRPMKRKPELKLKHNWGNIIPYFVSTVIRVYGFHGQPHIFPINVPLRLGFTKVMWQLGCIHEEDLTKKGKGTFFPDYTIVLYFVIFKGGWVHFGKVLSPYCLRVGTKRHSDPKGLFQMFRRRIKRTQMPHCFDFLEDLIKNEFDLNK